MRFLWLVHLIGIVARTLLWSAVFVVAVAISTRMHLSLSLAHRIAKNLTVAFVNGEIRGELQIGRIEVLEPDRIVVRHAALFDGEGRRIITGDLVELAPDFAALRHGLLHFRVGQITGGYMHLVDNGENEPSLFTTFDPRTPGHSGSDPLRALIDQVILKDVTLYGQFVQVRGVRAEHVNAMGRLSIADEVEITLQRAQGTVVQPYDFVGLVTSAHGTVSTDAIRGTRIQVVGKREHPDAPPEEVRVSVAYHSAAPSLPMELEVELNSDHITTDTLRSVGYTFAEPLAPPLRGHVLLSGPTDNLTLSASVDSPAGKAEISGSFSDARGVSVHVSTDAVQVAKLVDGAPDVRARGLVHFAIGLEDDAKPEVHAEIGAMRWGSVQIPPFVLDGELLDDGIRIDRARASQGGQIAVRGEVGWNGRTNLHVDAHFQTMQRDANLSHFMEDLQGSLTASLHIRTPPRDKPGRLDIDGKLELVDADYGSLHARRLLLVGKAHGDPSLPTLDVDVRGEDMQVLYYALGNAHFGLHGGPHTYTARGEFEAKGHKTFSFDAGVTADTQGFVVQAEPIEFTVGSESWRGALRNLTVVHERSIELGYLRLGSRAQRLEANGILRLAGEDELHAQLQNFDVAALRAVLGEQFPLAHGFADANLEMRGDVARPELSLSGALREATVGALERIDALYTVSYKGGHLDFDGDADLQDRGTLQILGQGELNPTISDPRVAVREGLYNLSLTGKHVDVTLIPDVARSVHSGWVDGTLDAQGGLESVTVNGHITARQLQALDWAELSVDDTFHYDHNELQMQLAVHDNAGPWAQANTTWHVDWRALTSDPGSYAAQELLRQDFRAQGQSAVRAMSDLPFTMPGHDLPMRIASEFALTRTAGTLQGSADVTLSPKQQLYDPSCKVSSDGSLRTHWTLSNDRAALTLDGQLDRHSVAAGSGAVEWAFDRLFQGERPESTPRFDVRGQLKLDQLERVPGLCRHGHGELSAQLDIRGAGRETPETAFSMRARFVPQTLNERGLVAAPVQRCVNEPLELTALAKGDHSGLTVEAAAHGCSGGPAKFNAKLPWTWNAKLPLPESDDSRETSLRLDLQDSEMEPVLDYLPAVRGFSGKGSGQINVKAQHGKVDARGQLALSGGRFYAIPTGQELRNVSLILTANGNWLKLDTLSARVGHGSFEAAGGIGLEGFRPKRFQLGLVMKELPVQREGLELAWLTGSAAIVGELEADKSRTAVKLHSLAVKLPSASSRSLQSLEPHADVALVNEAPKRLDDKPYSFEFAIDGRNQLTATRNDFEAALSCELDVSYRDPDLHVGGYIEFQRGMFELFGKRFEVNRGSMHFDGGTELNPEVSLVATHEPDIVGGSTVVANVSGTLAKPDVSFYSDRCPGEGAVILLVSGRCPTEADTYSTNPNATQDAFAAGIIGGILTLGAQHQLSGLVPKVAVESSARGTRTRLKAGWEAVPPFMRSLVQKVYLQGAISTADQTASSTNTSGATTPDFLLELYFPNNLVGAGRVAPTTRSWGVDVTWEP